MTLAFDRQQNRWPTLLVAAVVLLALVVPGVIGVMIEAPMRALAMGLHHVGWPITWLAGEIVVGTVRVPWSADCAGMAYLAALPAVSWFAAWRAGRALCLRRGVLLPLALALLVNFARVGSIIAYRLIFAPEVESAQLHYWLGFIWLLPALLVLLPSGMRTMHWLECLHLSVVLGLVSPHVVAPGGVVILCAAAVLAWRRTLTMHGASSAWLWLAWSAAAVWIMLSKMESLWLAWLLACPWRGIDWRREPYAAALLLCTVPLVAMNLWAVALLVPAAALVVMRWWRGNGEVPLRTRASGTLAQGALSCAFLLPFIALGLSGGVNAVTAPPSSIPSQPTARNSYELHLPRQPSVMRVDWIGSQGGGRHHTVQVCMAYRGEHLREAQPGSLVFTDGSVLRREFFLFPDGMINDYNGYLRRTFWPGSDAGVHLILSANASAMSVASFEAECLTLAGRIREHCRSSHP